MINRAALNRARINAPGVALPPFDNELFVSTAAPWGQFSPLDGDTLTAPWNQLDPRPLRTMVAWSPPTPKAIRTESPWRDFEDRSIATAVAHGQHNPKATRTAVPWRNLQPASTRTAAPWGQWQPMDKRLLSAYRHPPPKRTVTGAGWNQTTPMDRAWRLLYKHPPRNPKHTSIPWGQLSRTPTIVRPPFDPPDPPQPPGPERPPGNQVALAIYCPRNDYPGNQVPLRIAKNPCPGIDRRIWTVTNSMFVRRLDTGDIIDVSRAAVSTDYDSWVHRIRAEILGDNAWALVTAGEPVEIEIGINGNLWRGIVEQWADNQRFGEDSYTIEGRGLAAQLDAPYALPKSRFEPETRTARQLIEAELPAGWTAEPHPAFTDWTIPGEVFSYVGLTPAEAINRVAGAVGARVLADPVDQIIRLVPRWPKPAWQIAGAQYDIEIPESLVDSINRRWVSEPLRRGIYVSGETVGVLAAVKRTGTDGAPWMESLTDPLITQGPAGLQRGISELSATGKRRETDITIPVTTGEHDPGMASVGQILRLVSASGHWQGLVTQHTVGGAWDDTLGLVITQTLGVEQYDDE